MKKSVREEPLKLERVIGLTALNGAGILGSSTGTDMFYIAGCAVVQYSHTQHAQKAFYSTSKPIACIALSHDGRYLAAGERGHLPDIVIWDILKQERIMTLSGHKNGIGCMAFSPDQKFLVSAGFKPDKQLLVWDFSSGKKICSQRISNKVHAMIFHTTGDYFITAGDRHLKWWVIEEILEGESAVLRGTAASITEEYRLVTFTDVVCGSHAYSEKVYCTTNTGVLTVFNADKMVEKCVHVAAPLFSLEIFTAPSAPGLLILGGGNGEVYAYSPATLEKIASLPKPPPLPPTYTPPNHTHTHTHSHTPYYPACLAVRRLPGSRSNPIPKCVCVYADRGVCVYDIQDVYGAEVSVYVDGGHRGCVWNAVCVNLTRQAEGDDKPPRTTLLTCSADSAIRLWDIHTPSTPSLIHTIHMKGEGVGTGMGANGNEGLEPGGMDGDVTVLASTSTALSATLTPHAPQSPPFDYVYGIPDPELPPTPTPTPSSVLPTPLPRCLALHPLHTEIAVGDKAGCVYVYDMQTYALKKCIHAHNAEVMTLAYSPPMVPVHADINAPNLPPPPPAGLALPPPPPPMYTVWDGDKDRDSSEVVVLLATGGRDRLIHLFQASGKSYPLQDTLDYHTGSVTTVSFTPNGKYMVSCGSDKCMYIYTYTYTPQGVHVHIHRSINTHTHLYSLCIDPCSKFVVAAGQSRYLGIWNLNTGKLMRSYKHSAITTDLYKVTLDLSGSYIAVTGFDKRVYVLDFFSGEVLFISERGGHCELITDVTFTPNGKYLVTAGGEGGVGVWKVGATLVRGMRERLGELYASAQKKHWKVTGGGVEASVLASAASGVTGGGEEMVQSSLSNLKRKVSSRQSHEADAAAAAAGAGRVNKWASKLGEAGGGYELFGRKVSAAHPADHNKFTLELTSAPTLAAVEDAATASASASAGTASGGDGLGGAQQQGYMSPSKMAAEEGDGVLTYMSDEEDEEGMFKGDGGASSSMSPLPPLKASEEVRGGEEDRAEDASLLQAERKLDHLEKSAQDLENWLEAMLQSEGSSPPPLPSSTPDLGASMSAAYLRGAGKSTKDKTDNTAVATAPSGTAAATPSKVVPTPEVRVRESRAELIRVVDRMRVMEGAGDDDDDDDEAAVVRYSPSSPGLSSLMPPPPPTEQEEKRASTTDSTSSSVGVVSPASTTSPVVEEAGQGEVDRVVLELRQKAATFHNTLRELEAVKLKVSSSLQDLLKIHAELERHAGSGEGLVAPAAARDEEIVVGDSGDLRSSLHLTSELLGRFQKGLSSLSDMPLLQTLGSASVRGLGVSRETGLMEGSMEATSGMAGALDRTAGSEVSRSGSGVKSDAGDDVALSLFLEKYSDKLVEIVGEKILKQVKS